MEHHHKILRRALSLAYKPTDKGGSPHPTVKVAAILVDEKGKHIAKAVNRLAHGVDADHARYADGCRSFWINCAEQMVFAQALRKQASLKGATLYVTLEPCAVCAGLIAECGLRTVVVPTMPRSFYAHLKKKWKKSISVGRAKLKEAGVKVVQITIEDHQT